MSGQHSGPLLRPLLRSAVPSSQIAGNINSTIFLRLLFIISLGFLSLWANHQASKGFQLHILNDAAADDDDSPAGKRFSLFYISNGRAASILLNASDFVEHLLYYSHHPNRKPVRRVTLQLAAENLTGTDVSAIETFPGEFVIRLSPSLMSGVAGSRVDEDSAVKSAVLRGMAFVWLWDRGAGGEFRAPSWLIEAAVECVNRIAGFGGGDRVVAGLMEHCERRKERFVRQLNEGMMNGWDDRTTVERAAPAMRIEKLM
ncbi:hypothetical protein LINGRAHAP2_LOCUS19062 [Linum grandiflorum]